MLPDVQLFNHLYNIERAIGEEDPLGRIAQAIGTSGRQQDMVSDAALMRYQAIVDNTAHSFARAFGLGLRICEKIPKMYPKGLQNDDINGNYDCSIELQASDPIENDRLSLRGSTLYERGQIDLETNLIKYQGKTAEETKLIMAKILVDNATRNNPIIAEIMGRQLAIEMGMEQQYEAIKAEKAMMEKNLSPSPQIGIRGGEPRTGNVKTPTGREMIDVARTQGGQRSPAEA